MIRVHIKADHLFDAIDELLGVNHKAMIGTSRTRAVVDARRAYSHVHRDLGETYKAIAGKLHRDHSTIIYHVSVSREMLAHSTHYGSLLSAIFDNAMTRQEASHD